MAVSTKGKISLRAFFQSIGFMRLHVCLLGGREISPDAQHAPHLPNFFVHANRNPEYLDRGGVVNVKIDSLMQRSTLHHLYISIKSLTKKTPFLAFANTGSTLISMSRTSLFRQHLLCQPVSEGKSALQPYQLTSAIPVTIQYVPLHPKVDLSLAHERDPYLRPY